MRNLLKILIKYHFTVLFIALEVISVLMIVNYNNYQKVWFLNSGNFLAGGIYSSFTSVKQYFNLRRVNYELVKENSRLRTALFNELEFKLLETPDEITSIRGEEYRFMPAKVINNSVNRRYNYITLNKGRVHGIEPEMGVVADNCVVGQVINVSNNYCIVISVLNERSQISAKIKNQDYLGSISWEWGDYMTVSLNEIPFHVSISKGDTIVTSGYSTIFPGGLLIGTISGFKHEGGENFYEISVKLSMDFRRLVNVSVVDISRKDEIKKLETESDD